VSKSDNVVNNYIIIRDLFYVQSRKEDAPLSDSDGDYDLIIKNLLVSVLK
jgi:hypothetical protein